MVEVVTRLPSVTVTVTVSPSPSAKNARTARGRPLGVAFFTFASSFAS